ncbi:MAG: two-component system cell cycle response regulator [Bacteroidia bacterium]|jgi:diguanylate cyclase (GGDEF)-like protein
MSSVFEQLRSTGRLPSPSGVGAKILALTQDPEATIEDVAALLQRDPALTGRIMSVANSAQQAGAVALSTPKAAALRLGLRSVSSIAVGFTLVNANRHGHCDGFDYNAYWSTSLATAVASQSIAQLVNPDLAPEAFTAGLILRIGRLALASAQPEIYQGILAKWRGGIQNLRELETEAFGLNHAEVAEQLVKEWGMPTRVSRAIYSALCGTDQARPGEALELAKLLEFGSYLACSHIGMVPTVVDTDPQLAETLQSFGIEVDDFLASFEEIVRDWKELSADMQIVPLPPTNENGEPEGEQSEGQGDDQRPFVLIVDDDLISLRILSNCLTQSGFKVLATADPKLALVLAIQHEPSVLITDWLMPEIDGLSLCRALRRCESGRRIYIMVLTSTEDESACMRAFDAEADDFIRKPFQPKDLLSRVEIGVRLSAAQGSLETGGQSRLKPVNRDRPAGDINDITAADRALGQESGRDERTGLTNRVYATSRLNAFYEQDKDSAIAVIALNIDGLTTASTDFSLSATESLTVQVASLLQATIREVDTLCTSGSGGFLVLCPGADLKVVMRIAERLRLAIQSACISTDGLPGLATVSAGIAERGSSTSTATALFLLAEAALEFGAMGGPNQVHAAA